MKLLTPLVALALAAASSLAQAQAWPTKPVKILFGFPAGSATDIIARNVGQKLSEKWTPDLWQKILRDSKTAPAWVCDVIRKIAKEKAS